jgi:hypothetical protein
MREDELYNFRIWSKGTAVERELLLNFAEGPQVYQTDAVSIAEKVVTSDKIFSSAGNFISCYPNPTSGKLFFELSLFHSAEVSITAYDLSGQKVKALAPSAIEAGNKILQLNTSSLAAGKYVYEIKIGSQIFSGYFVTVR